MFQDVYIRCALLRYTSKKSDAKKTQFKTKGLDFAFAVIRETKILLRLKLHFDVNLFQMSESSCPVKVHILHRMLGLVPLQEITKNCQMALI